MICFKCFHGQLPNGEVYATNEQEALDKFMRLTPSAKEWRVIAKSWLVIDAQ